MKPNVASFQVYTMTGAEERYIHVLDMNIGKNWSWSLGRPVILVVNHTFC